MNEVKMIKKIQQGNIRAFESLINTYTQYIGTVVYSLIGTSMTSEDIEETVADVFVEVWKQPEKLMVGKIKSFLAAIARNLARNKLRERTNTVSIDENDYLIFDDRFEYELDIHEKSEIVSEALDILDENERDIFIRYYYFGQTSKMISESLDIPVSTITTKLSRGRKKMKEHLVKKGFVE